MSTLYLDLTVSLQRHPRDKCRNCGKRRVLFSLTALYPAILGTQRGVSLCAVCAGLR
jgi:hypothetical protein